MSPNKSAAKDLLVVKNLVKHFPIKSGVLKRTTGRVSAVNDVSFSIGHQEALGLVGESGSGKTTTARSIIRAINPTAGEVLFLRDDGYADLAKLNEKSLKAVWRDFQMIFQDPFSSLNSRYLVRDVIGESLYIHGIAKGKRLDERVAELLKSVDLDPEYMYRYPHAFSGGQRQRICVARALALNPKMILADEPTSALDVSVQAQILNLLVDLKSRFSLSYLFISHDMSVIRHISNRVAVMYAGEIVEIGETEMLFTSPLHPYSEALLAAVPKPNPRRKEKKILLPGDVPDPSNLPLGCPFHPRCSYVQDVCKTQKPPLVSVGEEPPRHVACHFAESLKLNGI